LKERNALFHQWKKVKPLKKDSIFISFVRAKETKQRKTCLLQRHFYCVKPLAKLRALKSCSEAFAPYAAEK